MIWDVLELLLLVGMSVLGFVMAIRPARRALFAQIRAGLAYALLVLHKWRSDDGFR